MFCGKCGTEVNDGTMFCPSCGTQLASQQMFRPCPPGRGIAGAIPMYNGVKTQGSKTKAVKIIAVLLAVLLLTISLFFIFGSSSAEKVAVNYAKAGLNGNVKKAYKCLAGKVDKLVDQFEDRYQDSFSSDFLIEKYGTDDIGKIYEKAYQEALDVFKDYFGEDFEFEVSVITSRDVTEAEKAEKIDELYSAVSEMVEKAGENGMEIVNKDILDTSKINELKEVKLSLTFSGENRRESIDRSIYCMKSGRSWKVIDCDFFENMIDIFSEMKYIEKNTEESKLRSIYSSACAAYVNLSSKGSFSNDELLSETIKLCEYDDSKLNIQVETAIGGISSVSITCSKGGRVFYNGSHFTDENGYSHESKH